MKSEKNKARDRLLFFFNTASLWSSLILIIIITILSTVEGLSPNDIIKSIYRYAIIPLLITFVVLIITSNKIKKKYDINILRFSNMEEVLDYLIKRIKKMNGGVIKDLVWLDNSYTFPMASKNLTKEEEQLKEFNNIVLEKMKQFNLEYKEIFTFKDKSKIDYLFQHIDLFGENYFCGFYTSKTGDCSKDCDLNCKIHKIDCNFLENFPKIQFMILNDKEVVFTSRRYMNDLCVIREKTIVNIFIDYYNQIIKGAIELKRGSSINEVGVKELIKYLKSIDLNYGQAKLRELLKHNR